mmetsp:Transcript_14148/g.26621  ORF Transcript_14148/g.26621 Transcript_14148/m.26621 type:complete len:357 (+) Transcript_14148:13-1083(+)
MSSSALTPVLDWLQSHPSTTSQMLARELSMPIRDSRILLEQAVEALGPDHFSVTYLVKHQDMEGNWTIAQTKTKPSEQGFLHSVQRKTDFTSSIYSLERQLNRIHLEDASRSQVLYRNETANIAPIRQDPRQIFKHLRTPQTARVPAPIKNETKSGKSESSEFTKPARPTPPQPNKAANFFKAVPRSPVVTKAVEPEKPKVKFDASEDKISNIKRTSTPHPIKSVGKVDCLEDIMKSDLYTVEEDDRMDLEPTPHIAKRKHSPDSASGKRIKTERIEVSPLVNAGNEENEKVPVYKIVKKKLTRTYMNEKGRLVTEDYVEEVREEVTYKPQPQPQSAKAGAVKKGTQTSIGAFFKK